MIPSALVPNVETLGYCQESLRDENEILRESVVWHGLPAFRDSNSVSSDKSVRQSFVEKGDSSGIVDPGYPKTEVTGLYSACERATEWLIYFMVIFSPWAFGTTQPWSIWVMNCCGYALGILLGIKLVLRWLRGYQPPTWQSQTRPSETGSVRRKDASVMITGALAILTIL